MRFCFSREEISPSVIIPLDTDTAMNAIKRYNFGDDLPEIVIVEESQYDKESNQTVHGWNDNIAVMRPLGKAGEIKRTDILDQEIYTQYGSSLISRNYAPIKGGLMLLENSVQLVSLGVGLIDFLLNHRP